MFSHWVRSLVPAPPYLQAPPRTSIGVVLLLLHRLCTLHSVLHSTSPRAEHVTLGGHVTLGDAHRLLAYTPPGSGNNAALLASSPQTLPLANPQTDPTPAIRSLVCKLAGIMRRQAEEIDRVVEALGLRKEPGILPNMLTGAHTRHFVQNSLVVTSHVAHPDTRCTYTSPTNIICASTL